MTDGSEALIIVHDPYASAIEFAKAWTLPRIVERRIPLGAGVRSFPTRASRCWPGFVARRVRQRIELRSLRSFRTGEFRQKLIRTTGDILIFPSRNATHETMGILPTEVIGLPIVV